MYQNGITPIGGEPDNFAFMAGLGGLGRVGFAAWQSMSVSAQYITGTSFAFSQVIAEPDQPLNYSPPSSQFQKPNTSPGLTILPLPPRVLVVLFQGQGTNQQEFFGLVVVKPERRLKLLRSSQEVKLSK